MNNYNRIKESVNYIEKNLMSPLSPSTLSQNAYISEYYFYRLFKTVVGTSVMDYIQKRRLSESVYRWFVNKKSTSLLNIALNIGFSSQSALTRSFKKSFSLTPSEYYKTEPLEEIFPPFNFWKQQYVDSSNVFDTEIEFVYLEPMILIGDSLSTTLHNNENFKDIDELLKRLHSAADQIEYPVSNSPFHVGVAYDGHIDMFMPDNITFEYFRGFHVSQIGQLPKGLKIKKIPGGQFIKINTTSNESVYSTTLDYIFSQILIKEDIKLEDHPINLIEKFRYDLTFENRYIGVEIYIPISVK